MSFIKVSPVIVTPDVKNVCPVTVPPLKGRNSPVNVDVDPVVNPVNNYLTHHSL